MQLLVNMEDIRNGHIHKPQPTLPGEFQEHDFMSYCGRQDEDYYEWISPYGHEHAIANLPGQGLTACDTANGLIEEEPIPTIWLSGSLNKNNEIEISQIAQIELSNKLTANILPYHAEILDAKTKLLAAVSLQELKCLACGCSNSDSAKMDPFVSKQFNAYLPVLPNAAIFRICKDDKVLWERAKFAVLPEVKITRCIITEKRELAITWKSNADEAALPNFSVQWRNSKPGKWKALLAGIIENKISIGFQYLSIGDIEIRVCLHDGFSSVYSNMYSIEIPPSPPQVAIINPVNEMLVNSESAILLWGYAVDCHGQNLPDNAMTWYLNGKVIGTGSILPMPMKSLKKKSDCNIELVVKDQYGSAKHAVVIRNKK